jgi:hypothetical protein
MIKLVGLPEALVGRCFVKANSVNEVFEIFPILKFYVLKLKISKKEIKGFLPCDG